MAERKHWSILSKVRRQFSTYCAHLWMGGLDFLNRYITVYRFVVEFRSLQICATDLKDRSAQVTAYTRKTVVQKLKSAGQPRYKIKEITGHASEASLNDYDVISEEERRELSHVISGYSASASRTTTSVPSIASSSKLLDQSTTINQLSPFKSDSKLHLHPTLSFAKISWVFPPPKPQFPHR